MCWKGEGVMAIEVSFCAFEEGAALVSGDTAEKEWLTGREVGGAL
jgi:hypothetical protein